MPEIIKKLTAAELEEKRNKIIAMARALDEARAMLKRECEQLGERQHLFYDIENEYLKCSDYTDAPKKLAGAVDRCCWKYFIDCSGIRDTMTEHRRRLLEQEVKESSPPYSAETAARLSANMRGLYVENMAETVREVFERLSGASYYTGNRKRVQNNLSKIDRMFRVNGNVSRHSWFGRWEVSDYANTFRYNDLEAVCFMLDGKRRPRYPETIEDRIKATQIESGSIVENEYFSVALYKNGNQKVTFKRLDVLGKLNQYGPKGDRIAPVASKIFS